VIYKLGYMDYKEEQNMICRHRKDSADSVIKQIMSFGSYAMRYALCARLSLMGEWRKSYGDDFS